MVWAQGLCTVRAATLPEPRGKFVHVQRALACREFTLRVWLACLSDLLGLRSYQGRPIINLSRPMYRGTAGIGRERNIYVHSDWGGSNPMLSSCLCSGPIGRIMRRETKLFRALEEAS